MSFLDTPVCEILGIRYPIIQGPMDWVAGPELVAAVSNAGGLGVLARSAGPNGFNHRVYSNDTLRAAIRKTKSLTDKPFGVGNVVEEEHMALLVEEGVPVVVTTGGHPNRTTDYLKRRGIVTVHMGASVRHAVLAEQAGVDAFIFSGYEAGGHDPGGNDRITTFAGLPQAVDAVKIPVLAAGGIADGRGVVAAFVLGAQGVRIGTRFASTVEAGNHPNHKQAIVNAIDTGTVYRGMAWKDHLRSIKAPYVDGLAALEASGASTEEIAKYIGGPTILSGTLQRRIRGEVDGDLENGEVHAGQISGLIKDIPTAGDVIRRIVEEAEAIVAKMSVK